MVALLVWLMLLALAGCTPATLPPTAPAVFRLPALTTATAGPRLEQGVGLVLGGRYASLTPFGRGDRVQVVDAATAQPLDTSALPDWAGPAFPHPSADGRYVTYDGFVEGRRVPVLWDLLAGKPVGLADLLDDPRQPDVTAAARTMIFIVGNPWAPALALYDPATGQEKHLPVPNAMLLDARTPAISADGRLAAFAMTTSRGDADLVVLDVATGRPITPPSLDGPADDLDPCFSPDGRTLVFSSDRNGSADLFACDLATGTLREVPGVNTLDDETRPRFADAHTIAFVSTRGGVSRTLVQVWR